MMDLIELSSFEEWIESALKNYTLEDYYSLSEDIQEEVELMYLQGEFYTAIEHINAELDLLINAQVNLLEDM